MQGASPLPPASAGLLARLRPKRWGAASAGGPRVDPALSRAPVFLKHPAARPICSGAMRCAQEADRGAFRCAGAPGHGPEAAAGVVSGTRTWPGPGERSHPGLARPQGSMPATSRGIPGRGPERRRRVGDPDPRHEGCTARPEPEGRVHADPDRRRQQGHAHGDAGPGRLDMRAAGSPHPAGHGSGLHGASADRKVRQALAHRPGAGGGPPVELLVRKRCGQRGSTGPVVTELHGQVVDVSHGAVLGTRYTNPAPELRGHKGTRSLTGAPGGGIL